MLHWGDGTSLVVKETAKLGKNNVASKKGLAAEEEAQKTDVFVATSSVQKDLWRKWSLSMSGCYLLSFS